MAVTLSDAWEERAEHWIAWARTPDHDGFWEGTWPELEAVLPEPRGLVVEIGCGEGRVGRALLSRCDYLVGVERSSTLAHAARHATAPIPVIRADAAELPIADVRADTVVACMSLHDVDDLQATIREAARVLRPRGHLCVALVHPFATAQDPSTMHTDLPVVTEPYLVERRFEDHVERDGLEMTFVSMHRPLSAYLSAFANAGLVLEAVREFGTKPIPWLLVARLVKLR